MAGALSCTGREYQLLYLTVWKVCNKRPIPAHHSSPEKSWWHQQIYWSKKDLWNESQKFMMRLNCMISLEYFSVMTYFYGRKSRDITSLLSYLSLGFTYSASAWLVAAVFPSLPPAPPPASRQKQHNTLIQPPTSVLSFPCSSWEGCAQHCSSSTVVVLDKKKGVRGLAKGTMGSWWRSSVCLASKKQFWLLADKWVLKILKRKQRFFFLPNRFFQSETAGSKEAAF